MKFAADGCNFPLCTVYGYVRFLFLYIMKHIHSRNDHRAMEA